MTTSLPSKQFLIRGGIATALVVLVLIVQTDWFHALFHKTPLQPGNTDQTVGDLLSKDSNSNGIADWEEKLWGLDPMTLYTNGVPNKTIIEQKKAALGVASQESQTPVNETDELARELSGIAIALAQEGQSAETLAAVAAKMAQSLKIAETQHHYSLKDLRTITTSTESLQVYYTTFRSMLAKYNTGTADIDILLAGVEREDFSRASELAATGNLYQKYAAALIQLPVPVGLQKEHLDIANSIYAMGVSLQQLSQVDVNALVAVGGIALYRISDQTLTAASDQMITYLTQYGILNGQ
ncbi:hypothetical protein IT401_02470 [Candidatus Nomurabacteria bacterium]|nr:hypothetical protein [Candidatus Nomurabacteria bacterium]